MNRELLKKLCVPMSDAIDAGNLEEVIRMLDEHPEALHFDTPLGPWLHMAASAGQVPIMKELVRRGVDLNRRGGTFEANALHMAANKGQFEAVKYLLEAGSDMELTVSEKDPLFAAILRDHDDIAQLLIDHGLDPHHDYGDEWNATFFAYVQGAKKCLKLLESLPQKAQSKSEASPNAKPKAKK